MNHSSAAGNQNTILKVIGIIALLAGLAIGGLALVSALGVWLGLWDFRTSFGLLGIANGWGDIVAIICVLDGITILVLAQVLKASNGMRMASLAFVGAAAAALAYYIPESYRPGDDIPPIHDISTDTVNPPVFVAVLPLRADAANTADYGGSEGMTPAELARLSTEAYPDLVPFTMAVPPDQAFARALAAVNALGWDLVAEVPGEGRIEATDTTFWMRFKDDVVIRIRPDGSGSVVDARSVSRVGRSDVGKNAERLREFFALL